MTRNSFGAQMLRGLITRSIDISYEQMNRIGRALRRMSRGERDPPTVNSFHVVFNRSQARI